MRLLWVVAVSLVAAPAYAQESPKLALPGRFVLPDLIDTHVHLATDPDGEDARPRAERRLKITAIKLRARCLVTRTRRRLFGIGKAALALRADTLRGKR